MKKLPFYIVLGVAAAAIAALLVVLLTKKPSNTSDTSTTDTGTATESTPAFAKVKSWNWDLQIPNDEQNVSNEIYAVQTLINNFKDEDGNYIYSIVPSGTLDATTQAAIASITANKPSTTLFEFYYIYAVPNLGQETASAIMDTLTDKG